MNILGHLKTILHHKRLVAKGCFKVGLYKQGILHDMSKFSPTEFIPGCIYFQGNMSPNNAERNAKGYSSAWLHHKGRNKHHLEYWIDYAKEHEGMVGMRMPDKYVVEMFIDRMSASKTYLKDKYTDASPLEYYMRGKNAHILHPECRELLETLLTHLRDEGEEKTFKYIREQVLKNNKK